MMSPARRIFVRAAMAFGLAFGLGATAPRAQAQLHGIDVSNYQGNVNWTSVKNAGNSFAFCKATEGTTFTDAYLKQNWAGIHTAGMVRGAYHFGHPGTSATTQAQYFVNAVRNAGGFAAGSNSLQLVLDLETTDGLSPSQVWAWVQSFVAEIKILTGRPAIIYTGYYFWRDSVGNPTNNLNCPLWIAAYGVSSPMVPPAWGYWTFWQYSDTGSVPGVSGNVDHDYFNGSLTTLYKFCF